LRPGGVYVMNVIDYPPLRFARAEVSTLRRLFPHVAVVAPAAVLAGREGGNVVLVGATAPIDAERLRGTISRRSGEETVAVDVDAAAFAAGAPALVDDHAPVDQWLARSRRPKP